MAQNRNDSDEEKRPLLKQCSSKSPQSKNEQVRSANIDINELLHDPDIPSVGKSHELRFPEKLMLLLAYVERESAKNGKKSDESCLAWTPDGKAFVIRNESEFANTVLPLVFGRSKFSSFTRRLYRWGFRRIGTNAASGKDVGVGKLFFHEYFQRDNKQLLAKIQGMTPDGAKNGPLNLPTTVSFPVHLPQPQQLPPTHTSLPSNQLLAMHASQHQQTLMSSLLASQSERCAMTIMDALQQLPAMSPPNVANWNSLPSVASIMTQHDNRARSLAPAAVHQLLESINRQSAAGQLSTDPSLYPLLQSALAIKMQRELKENGSWPGTVEVPSKKGEKRLLVNKLRVFMVTLVVCN